MTTDIALQPDVCFAVYRVRRFERTKWRDSVAVSATVNGGGLFFLSIAGLAYMSSTDSAMRPANARAAISAKTTGLIVCFSLRTQPQPLARDYS